jgi:hypothetical protein
MDVESPLPVKAKLIEGYCTGEAHEETEIKMEGNDNIRSQGCYTIWLIPALMNLTVGAKVRLFEEEPNSDHGVE